MDNWEIECLEKYPAPRRKKKTAKKPVVKTKSKKPPKDTLLNHRVSVEEHKIIKRRAKEFAKGNVSRWVLMASLNYRPKA